MTKKMIVRIHPDGSVFTETVGVTGPVCQKYVDQIAAMTGGAISHTVRKPEFFDTNQHGVSTNSLIVKENEK